MAALNLAACAYYDCSRWHRLAPGQAASALPPSECERANTNKLVNANAQVNVESRRGENLSV